jgi:hypothetical protein
MESAWSHAIPKNPVSVQITVSGENVPGAEERESIFSDDANSVEDQGNAHFVKARAYVFCAMERASWIADHAREGVITFIAVEIYLLPRFKTSLPSY